MPVTIDGTNGVSLVQDSIITASKLSLTANSAPIMTALNASGSAPIYACRAWVNFNGAAATSPFTIANGGIRGAGNVSSITDNGVGDYTVNFTTAMQDANYAVSAFIQRGDGAGLNTGLFSTYGAASNGYTPTASAVRVVSTGSTGTPIDVPMYSVSIFR